MQKASTILLLYFSHHLEYCCKNNPKGLDLWCVMHYPTLFPFTSVIVEVSCFSGQSVSCVRMEPSCKVRRGLAVVRVSTRRTQKSCGLWQTSRQCSAASNFQPLHHSANHDIKQQCKDKLERFLLMSSCLLL